MKSKIQSLAYLILPALTLGACGMAPELAAPANPINEAQRQNLLSSINPAPGNISPFVNGKLIGEWIRKSTDTTCATPLAQSTSTKATSWSYYIGADGASGSQVVTYSNGAMASVPTQYDQSQMGVIKTSRGVGPINCFDPSKTDFCKKIVDATLPNLSIESQSISEMSVMLKDQFLIEARFTRDPLCTWSSASTAKLIRSLD
ncbi:MAG: hypothetical protein ACO3A2_10025 [Bdellovibrionia bacterium]